MRKRCGSAACPTRSSAASASTSARRSKTSWPRCGCSTTRPTRGPGTRHRQSPHRPRSRSASHRSHSHLGRYWSAAPMLDGFLAVAGASDADTTPALSGTARAAAQRVGSVLAPCAITAEDASADRALRRHRRSHRLRRHLRPHRGRGSRPLGQRARAPLRIGETRSTAPASRDAGAHISSGSRSSRTSIAWTLMPAAASH